MNFPDSINELARIEEELEYQLAVVNQQISALKHRSNPEEWQGGGDNTPLSEEAYAKQALEARDHESEPEARLSERAAGLEHALRRIQDGSYGTCELCGRSIDRKRLHAFPEAQYCMNCAERLEASPPGHCRASSTSHAPRESWPPGSRRAQRVLPPAPRLPQRPS